MGTDARGFPLGDLRASDAERDWSLSEACQFGRITADELDRWSTQAYRWSTQALSVRTGKKLTARRRPVGYLVSRLTMARAARDSVIVDRYPLFSAGYYPR
jgi:hypothetical protein